MAGVGTWTVRRREDYISQCTHGVDLTIPVDNHPVTSFMDTHYLNGVVNKQGIIDNLRESFQTHTEVWDNKNYRLMAINIFIAIGTNFLLKYVTEDASNIANISHAAYAIVALENYDGIGDFGSVIYNRVAAAKIRDFQPCSIRDMLKFFRKRTNCSCLKDMHLEARKTFAKGGQCFGCGEVKERALLMVCSRCRVIQYCSRKCQIADWPRHKCGCDACVSTQEQKAKKR